MSRALREPQEHPCAHNCTSTCLSARRCCCRVNARGRHQGCGATMARALLDLAAPTCRGNYCGTMDSWLIIIVILLCLLGIGLTVGILYKLLAPRLALKRGRVPGFMCFPIGGWHSLTPQLHHSPSPHCTPPSCTLPHACHARRPRRAALVCVTTAPPAPRRPAGPPPPLPLPALPPCSQAQGRGAPHLSHRTLPAGRGRVCAHRVPHLPHQRHEPAPLGGLPLPARRVQEVPLADGGLRGLEAGAGWGRLASWVGGHVAETVNSSLPSGASPVDTIYHV